MKTFVAVVLVGVVTIAGIGVPKAWATSTITLSRNDSTPRTLKIKPGDDVRFINATGGRAQLWFGGQHGLRLFVSPGGSLVKFDRAGTFDYSVNVSEAKASAHNGEVVVH
jgi:plastocyanin